MELSKFEILNMITNKTKNLSNIKHKHDIQDIENIQSIVNPYVKKEVLNAKIDEIDSKLNKLSFKKPLDGKTPIKGIDYEDGKTPIKGIDYFDGKDAEPLILGNVKYETIDSTKKAEVKIEQKDNKLDFDFKFPSSRIIGDGGRSIYGQATEEYVDNKINDIDIPTKISDLEIDIDTDDIPETATNMYVPTLPTDSPTAKYLNGNKEWKDIAVGSGGYSANLYFTTIDSDVTGYKKIEYIAEATETELTIPCTTTEILARTYLYDYGIDTTVIDAGRWVATYRAKVSSTKGATIRFKAFLRHIDNSETTLFSSSSDKIINTDYATLKNENTQPIFSCVETDRLGVRIYASTTHPAGVTLNTIVGDGNGSYFGTPLSIRHSQLRNLNEDRDYQHITDADRTKLNNTSGVNTGDSPRIVSQTKLNNYTQTSTLENNKLYTYIRDEDNIVIDTIITEVV